MTLPKAIILEIDSVLSDDSKRRHFIESPYIKERFQAPFVSVATEDYIAHKHWQPDWNAYHAAASDDPVNEWCDRIIFSFNRLPHPLDTRIIFITGRPEKYREQTIDWIDAAIKCHSYELLMRPDFLPCDCGFQENPSMPRLDIVCRHCDEKSPDLRPSHIVKREIFEREIQGKYDPLFVIEKDVECAEIYKGLGLTVLRVM